MCAHLLPFQYIHSPRHTHRACAHTCTHAHTHTHEYRATHPLSAATSRNLNHLTHTHTAAPAQDNMTMLTHPNADNKCSDAHQPPDTHTRSQLCAGCSVPRNYGMSEPANSPTPTTADSAELCPPWGHPR